MEKIIKQAIFILLLPLIYNGYGQTPGANPMALPQLVLKARALNSSVMLRWGTNDRFAWKKGIENGYVIERTTISRNGIPLKEVEKKILNSGPILPKPLNSWEKFILNNDMAAVTAQAIYGENFNVDNSEENPFIKIINQSSELQQRFAFSMFAVDQDFEVALFAGLGYVDNDVHSNERYLYNIKFAEPNELNIKETGTLIAPGKSNPLPKPYDFAGYYYNNSFVLIWEYDNLQHFYNAYDLEKSEDGVTFKKVNNVPITKLNTTDVSGISYVDSIPQYSKKYWYRIKGKTIFNETSPASDTVSVIAYKELLVAPEFKDNDVISDKVVDLTWSFAQDEEWKVTSYELLRSNTAPGPYIKVIDDIDPANRKVTYSNLQDINYFKIRAKGIAGDFQDSSPNMVQPIDSIPPSKPSDLIGVIDTLGVVRITWEENPELDLRGYVLMRANRPNQEFTRLNKQEIKETEYTDTINLKSFNKSVFYKLKALDSRYNESIPSDVLQLKRPSKIPPINPVFTTYEVYGDTVHLEWIPSISENIVRQIIYRKKADTNEDILWENISEITDNSVSNFNDPDTETNQKYLYTITAVNEFMIASKPSPPISITTMPELIKPGVKGLYANVDRENRFIQLSWRINGNAIAEIEVYRKDSESQFTKYATLKKDERQFFDTKLILNTIYTYALKVLYNDGSMGVWEEIKVKF
ncbi:fibronectin type III domain-containing protein [Maribacter polysaccharolyticus]|uniref:fibronectin type III domain-containing protein n=1 Tax=Maribacter polysaccharolyticus TaxID=3020831 RepID=UPI00237FC474|nr:fibronectin type III domain-containing protein [Maribacter polysaccharolyticus]MDE3743068.1 fibronectin type III domain-containing protein [Maribacter polysaccharolyticus]